MIHALYSEYDDICTLIEMVDEEEDRSMVKEIEKDIAHFEEDFEKLILAYDYSTRRNSKYAALNEEDRMVENGRYRYPDLKFIQRRP